jgi:hypothetical protein
LTESESKETCGTAGIYFDSSLHGVSASADTPPVEILLSLRFEKLFPTSTRKQTLWSRAFFDAELHTLSLRRWLQGKICVTYLAAAKLHPVASKAEARLDSELTDFSC